MALILSDIRKIYQMGDNAVAALAGVSLKINNGEFTAIMGPSGSGKSTLMNVLGCLDRPSSGSYLLDEKEVAFLNDNELAETRNQKIGFVFQNFNLLPRLTAIQNVALPLAYAGLPKTTRHTSAVEALQAVGLHQRLHHLPNELSGGQRQRVAIARALVNKPMIIIADEPTGALDSQTGVGVMEIFRSLNAEGRTIILVTHEQEIAKYANRVISIRDGLVVRDTGEG